MKKQNLLKTILITLSFILLGAGELKANGTEVGGICYTFSGSNATVTFTGTSYSQTTTYTGSIVIPSQVTNENTTYTVTSIDKGAFYKGTGITSITIPSSVTSIDSYAFYGCTALSSLSDISYVISIGDYAFQNCTSLTSITIPSGVTIINSNCFNGCTGLTSITLHSSLNRIGDYAFKGCSNAALTSVIIPSSVTVIGNNAFEGCTGLTSVTIPSSVTSLGSSAFRGCSKIGTLVLGEGLTSIPGNAFNGCNKISSLTIPSSVTNIGNSAFYNCSTIETIVIPSNVTTIGNYSFYGCSSVKTLSIGAKITTIPERAFCSCSSLENVIIPSNINTIGAHAFYSCTKLTDVYMLRTTHPSLTNVEAFKNGYSGPYANIHVMSSTDNSVLEDYNAADVWTNLTIDDFTALTIDNLDLTGTATPLTILSGNAITVTGTLTNPDASKLVIEDGAQLICNNSVAATVQKSIGGWGSKDASGWNFIASPIAGSIDPKDAGLITDNYTSENLPSQNDATYDLYYLDMTAEKDHEWQNYRKNAFNLANGKGYLYANVGTPTLNFSGDIQPSNTTVTKSGLYNGYNLVGNPFTCNAYLNRSYYTLNSDGSAVEVNVPQTDPIAPCTGVIIENTSVTFSKNHLDIESSNNGNVQLVLAQSVTTRGESNIKTIDNAIISFNEGSQLGKFYFGTQDANLYIPMNNEEYAIVSSSAQGEMPVNFKAHRDGQYTITVNPQEVEMGYLHLIDNIVGVDVDLLATPSYTFNAKADDYESRFRLVFSANMVNTDLDDDFAFFSNGQLVITNEGESLLQVIDVNGRIVMTESVNGTCSKAINVKAGVYVLRLIQGTDVKTQKIIVK